MKKIELLNLLAGLPDDAPIFIVCEGGVDFAKTVSVQTVKKIGHDWQNTPIGNYRTPDDWEFEEMQGDAFECILVE